MAQFTIYRSTDSGAPTLNGTTGSLVTVLASCLVSGYGSTSGAGWTLPYTSGTTRAAFRQGGGNQFYLRIYDEAIPSWNVSAGGRGAAIGGLESMTAIDAASGFFPPNTGTAIAWYNNTTGLVGIRKSSTADTTARPWIVVADNRTVYVFVQTGDAVGAYQGWMFGDFYSYKVNDNYRTMIMGRSTDSASYTASDNNLDTLSAHVSASINFNIVARSHLGLGSAIQVGRVGHSVGFNLLNGPFALPNPEDSSIFLNPIYIVDVSSNPAYVIRGKMRGFWQWLHGVSAVTDGDTFNGTGALAGRSFLIIKATPNGGLYIIETSNTLDTN